MRGRAAVVYYASSVDTIGRIPCECWWHVTFVRQWCARYSSTIAIFIHHLHWTPPLILIVLSRLDWGTQSATGTLRCLQKEMATYRHWSVSLWRDPDDVPVPHCRILSPDKTEWRLISATLCGWRRCFVADQLWFITRIREEEEATEMLLLKAPFNEARREVCCTHCLRKRMQQRKKRKSHVF